MDSDSALVSTAKSCGDVVQYILSFLKIEQVMILKHICRDLRIAAQEFIKRTIEEKVKTDPEAAIKPNLMTFFAKSGDIEMMKWGLRKNYNWETLLVDRRGRQWDFLTAKIGDLPEIIDPTIHMASGGHLEAMKWLYKEGHFKSFTGADSVAAAAGHLDILQWIRKKKIGWSRDLDVKAAKGGHLSVLQWLHGTGHVFDEVVMHESVKMARMEVIPFLYGVIGREKISRGICRYAAASGDEATLNWFLERGHRKPNDIYEGATREGHLNMLKFLKTKNCPVTPYLCDIAAKNGKWQVLEWLNDNGSPWTANTLFKAIKSGCLKTLQFLYENGCPTFKDLCCKICEVGKPDMLEWAITKGFGIDESCAVSAATRATPDCLKVLRKYDCPWDTIVRSIALETGNLEAFRWAAENGCPPPDSDDPSEFELASYHENMEALEYLHSINSPWNIGLVEIAAEKGNLAMLKWAREKGYNWDEKFLETATRHGHLEILQWANDNGFPKDIKVFHTAAVYMYWNIVLWAFENDYPWDASCAKLVMDGGKQNLFERMLYVGFGVHAEAAKKKRAAEISAEVNQQCGDQKKAKRTQDDE